MAAMATIVAITGDIGAGKSTVARLMEAYGGIRFDADVVTHKLWLRSDIRDAAISRWGQEVLCQRPDDDIYGNGINHAFVAKCMFSSTREYDWACDMLHPLVMAELARSVAILAPDQWAIAEIPLLFEVGRPNWANVVVYVTAPYETRLERCKVRGWDEAELARRESFYLPTQERARHSDFVISNNGNLDDLKSKVRNVLEEVLHHSSRWLCWLYDDSDTSQFNPF